ncbi:MAG: hypothetical protein ACETWB_04905 [Anaerolineae bacterium]
MIIAFIAVFVNAFFHFLYKTERIFCDHGALGLREPIGIPTFSWLMAIPDGEAFFGRKSIGKLVNFVYNVEWTGYWLNLKIRGAAIYCVMEKARGIVAPRL